MPVQAQWLYREDPTNWRYMVLTDESGWNLRVTIENETNITVWGIATLGSSPTIDLSQPITNLTDDVNIAVLGSGLFSTAANRAALKRLVLPNTVTNTGSKAFLECTVLTNVVFSSELALIGANAFQSCTTLTNLVLPSALVSIGNDAFRDCKSRTSLEFPDTLVTIGGSAFINTPTIKRVFFKGDYPQMAGNAAFLNNAKYVRDTTLPAKTRCYFIPFGNDTWRSGISTIAFGADDVYNFSTNFTDISGTPASLIDWFSFRSAGGSANISWYKQYLGRWNPEEAKRSLFIDGEPVNAVTNLGATSFTFKQTNDLSHVATWLWDAPYDQVHLLAGDALGEHSLTTGAHWSDGRTPHADADYFVGLGYDNPMRTAFGAGYDESWYAVTYFYGRSLTLGEVGGAEGWLHWMDSSWRSVQHVGRMTWANGGILRAVGTTTGNGLNATKITVSSTGDAPFRLLGAYTTATDLRLNPTLYGDENAGVLISNAEGYANGFRVYLSDNPNYFGRIIADGSNNWMSNGSAATGFGANPASLVTNAIVLRNGGGLAFTGNSATLPNRRGFEIGPGLGQINSSGTLTLAAPITGTGETLFNGSGTVRLTGAYTAGEVTVINGVLRFTSSATLAEGVQIGVQNLATLQAPPAILEAAASVVVASNGMLRVTDGAATPAVTCEACSLVGAFTSGGITLDFNKTTGACDLLHFGEVSTFEGKVKLVLSPAKFPPSDGAKKYEFMTLPLSARSLTPRDFDISAIQFDTPDGLDPEGKIIEVTVSIDNTGLQHVYIGRAHLAGTKLIIR